MKNAYQLSFSPSSESHSELSRFRMFAIHIFKMTHQLLEQYFLITHANEGEVKKNCISFISPTDSLSQINGFKVRAVGGFNMTSNLPVQCYDFFLQMREKSR